MGGYNATLAGTGTSFIAGKFTQQQAIQFDGSSNYLTVPYSSALGLNAYTFSTWVNVNPPAYNGASGRPALVSTRNSGDATFDLQYYQYAVGSYELHADIGSGSGWLDTTANYVLPGPLTGWNMITYTANSSGYSIYVNGTAVVANAAYTTGGTPLFMNAGQTLSFGSQQANTGAWGAGGYLNGAMEETGIYNGAMTSTQVASLYQSGLGQLPSTTAVSIAQGATLDLGGISQTVDSLSDIAPGQGGLVTNSAAGSSVTLTLGLSSTASNTFSGTIQDGAGKVSLSLSDLGNFNATLVLAGVNTFTGTADCGVSTLILANSGALCGATVYGTSNSYVVFAPSIGSFTFGGLSGSYNWLLQDSAGSAVALTVGANNQNAALYRLAQRRRRGRVVDQGRHGHADPRRRQQLYERQRLLRRDLHQRRRIVAGQLQRPAGDAKRGPDHLRRRRSCSTRRPAQTSITPPRSITARVRSRSTPTART